MKKLDINTQLNLFDDHIDQTHEMNINILGYQVLPSVALLKLDSTVYKKKFYEWRQENMVYGTWIMDDNEDTFDTAL